MLLFWKLSLELSFWKYCYFLGLTFILKFMWMTFILKYLMINSVVHSYWLLLWRCGQNFLSWRCVSDCVPPGTTTWTWWWHHDHMTSAVRQHASLTAGTTAPTRWFQPIRARLRGGSSVRCTGSYREFVKSGVFVCALCPASSETSLDFYFEEVKMWS